MFNPLLTVMVAILAYVIFGENLYAGSVIRGVLVILGLYMLLWGKDKDQEQEHLSEGKDDEHESSLLVLLLLPLVLLLLLLILLFFLHLLKQGMKCHEHQRVHPDAL